MSDHLERDENAEPRLAKEPRLRTDPNEAIEPIENAEPIDPIERNEPFDPIDRNESCDHSDRLNDMVRFSHGPSEIHRSAETNRCSSTSSRILRCRSEEPASWTRPIPLAARNERGDRARN